MNKQKPLYKLLDDKGRVLIPKELREAADMRCGDIIKLGIQKGIVTAQKVDIIEVGDQSAEAVEAFRRQKHQGHGRQKRHVRVHAELQIAHHRRV